MPLSYTDFDDRSWSLTLCSELQRLCVDHLVHVDIPDKGPTFLAEQLTKHKHSNESKTVWGKHNCIN